MTDPWAKDPDLKAAMEAMYGPQPINDGEGFLHHLKANPTLLDPAPTDRDEWGAAMRRRVDDEVHSCLRCGEQAHQAIIAETPDRPRFLDLCFDCVHWLKGQMDEAGMRPW
jgi:hypothetical protein